MRYHFYEVPLLWSATSLECHFFGALKLLLIATNKTARLLEAAGLLFSVCHRLAGCLPYGEVSRVGCDFLFELVFHRQFQDVGAERSALWNREFVTVEVIAAIIATQIFSGREDHAFHDLAGGRHDFNRRTQNRAVLSVGGRFTLEVTDFRIHKHRLSRAELVPFKACVVAEAGDVAGEHDVSQFQPGFFLQFLNGQPKLGDCLRGPVRCIRHCLVREVIGNSPEHLLPEFLIWGIQTGNGLQGTFLLS